MSITGTLTKYWKQSSDIQQYVSINKGSFVTSNHVTSITQWILVYSNKSLKSSCFSMKFCDIGSIMLLCSFALQSLTRRLFHQKKVTSFCFDYRHSQHEVIFLKTQSSILSQEKLIILGFCVLDYLEWKIFSFSFCSILSEWKQ